MRIGRVGIVGAGTMGSGIATNLAQHGVEVRLVDTRSENAKAALGEAARFFERAVSKGRMEAQAAEQANARLAVAEDPAGLADCDLVIEAVFEEFGLKARLFEELGGILPADTLVATNTSCLRVSDLAAHMARPERFLGLHYFSPAAVNPIVEVVRGRDTADEAVSRAMEFCRATGKKPLAVKDSFGFAINRFFCPYTNEAARALDEGMGSTAQIDAVAREALGAAAGPFLVMNLIKPRINLDAIRNLGPLGGFYAPAASMVETGEADRSWAIGEAAPLDAEAAGAIADRLRAGAFLPVLQALDEEVAAPADFDLGAREALKFGRPPCALMDELGREEVERVLAPVLAAHGLAAPASLARVGSLTR